MSIPTPMGVAHICELRRESSWFDCPHTRWAWLWLTKLRWMSSRALQCVVRERYYAYDSNGKPVSFLNRCFNPVWAREANARRHFWHASLTVEKRDDWKYATCGAISWLEPSWTDPVQLLVTWFLDYNEVQHRKFSFFAVWYPATVYHEVSARIVKASVLGPYWWMKEPGSPFIF
jgi:hypothetical protein